MPSEVQNPRHQLPCIKVVFYRVLMGMNVLCKTTTIVRSYRHDRGRLEMGELLWLRDPLCLAIGDVFCK